MQKVDTTIYVKVCILEGCNSALKAHWLCCKNAVWRKVYKLYYTVIFGEKLAITYIKT